MSCLFCEIAAGRRQSRTVYQDERCVAFLDHRPLFHGHSLVVPRAHHETLAELPEELVAPLFHAARRVATAVERALAAEGTFVAINNRVSQSVPHLHVHVVPRRRKDGLRGFFWPRQPYASEEQAAQVQAALREELRRLEGG